MKRIHLLACWLFSVAVLNAQTLPLLAEEPRSLTELAKAKRDIAKRTFERATVQIYRGHDADQAVHEFGEASKWSKRWADAEQELGSTREAKIRAAEEHLERLNKLFKLANTLVVEAKVSPATPEVVQYDCLEAETALLKLKDQKK